MAIAIFAAPLLSFGNRIVFILLVTCWADYTSAASPTCIAEPLPSFVLGHFANFRIGQIPIRFALHKMLRHPMLRELGVLCRGDMKNVASCPIQSQGSPDRRRSVG